MYQVKYSLTPSIVDELFKQKSTSYSLRNSDFDFPTFNTINYGKHSLRYQGPYLWSKLDNKLKDSLNIGSFKKNIRKKDLTLRLKGHCHAIWQLHKKLGGVFASIEFQT